MCFIYVFSVGFSFYIVWNIWILFGIVVGSLLFDLIDFGFDFVIVVIFIVLVIFGVKNFVMLVIVFIVGVVVMFLKS